MPELLLFSVRKATTHTAPLTLLIKSDFCWFQTFISHNYFLLQTILTQCLISKFVILGVFSELLQVQTLQRLAKKFNLEPPLYRCLWDEQTTDQGVVHILSFLYIW